MVENGNRRDLHLLSWQNYSSLFKQRMLYFSHCTRIRQAPMAHSYRLGLVTWGYQIWIPVGTNICHRGCAYPVRQTVQRHEVNGAAYSTVHYKEPLKSFEIRVGHSPGFGLLSVAILPWLCRKRRKAIFIYLHQDPAIHCRERWLTRGNGSNPSQI